MSLMIAALLVCLAVIGWAQWDDRRRANRPVPNFWQRYEWNRDTRKNNPRMPRNRTIQSPRMSRGQ